MLKGEENHTFAMKIIDYLISSVIVNRIFFSKKPPDHKKGAIA